MQVTHTYKFSAPFDTHDSDARKVVDSDGSTIAYCPNMFVAEKIVEVLNSVPIDGLPAMPYEASESYVTE